MRATKEYRLAMTDEAQKLVDQMTLEQKVSLMGGNIFITKMTPEMMAEMAEAMSSDENHYNVTPYAAGGLEEFNLPPMLFADGRGVLYVATGRLHVFRFPWREAPLLTRN